MGGKDFEIRERLIILCEAQIIMSYGLDLTI
jgi:hypothetical protein